MSPEPRFSARSPRQLFITVTMAVEIDAEGAWGEGEVPVLPWTAVDVAQMIADTEPSLPAFIAAWNLTRDRKGVVTVVDDLGNTAHVRYDPQPRTGPPKGSANTT